MPEKIAYRYAALKQFAAKTKRKEDINYALLYLNQAFHTKRIIGWRGERSSESGADKRALRIFLKLDDESELACARVHHVTHRCFDYKRCGGLF